MQTFCNQFTDMARGVTKIPDTWWPGWLSATLGRSTFPKDWKRAIKLAFISDWDARHPKALGIQYENKNGAANKTGDWMPQRELGELYQLIKIAKERGDKEEEESLRNELAELQSKNGV